MLETYLQYFEANYNGARAPLHIGHHFSKWNGGAYWDAMKSFARKVCHLPDVQCVTNAALADYLDRRGQDMAALEPPRNRTPLKLSTAPEPYDIDLEVRVARGAGGAPVLEATATGNDIARLLQPSLELAAAIDMPAMTLGTPSAKALELLTDNMHAHLRKSMRRQFAVAPAADGAGDFKIVISDGVREILTQTFAAKDVKIGARLVPREARAMLGDLPEAHLDEGAPDGHPMAIPSKP
jgi:hypothetical protein